MYVHVFIRMLHMARKGGLACVDTIASQVCSENRNTVECIEHRDSLCLLL